MIDELSKYRRHFSLTAQQFLAYRFSVFCSISVDVFYPIALILFWKAVYGAGEGAIAGFDLSDMVMYMIVKSFVSVFIHVRAPESVRKDIVGGGMTRHLLIPASYLLTHFFQNTGYKVSVWISMTVLLALLFLFFLDDLQFADELWVYPGGLLALILAYLLMFHFCFCLGLVSFWTESTPPLIAPLQVLFGGSVVPLVLLPEVLQKLADLLPFKSMLYFPIMVLIGKLSPEAFLYGIAMQALWLLIMLAGVKLLWWRGGRRYAAYGG